MSGTLLTDFQSACRAAHEQVQMLQDLYEHLGGADSGGTRTSIDAQKRMTELRDLEELLARKLREQDLLPTRPDPEREGLLELITGMKASVTGEARPAADERLAAEETELLQHVEQMLKEDDDASIGKACARTREAVAQLCGSAADHR